MATVKTTASLRECAKQMTKQSIMKHTKFLLRHCEVLAEAIHNHELL